MLPDENGLMRVNVRATDTPSLKQVVEILKKLAVREITQLGHEIGAEEREQRRQHCEFLIDIINKLLSEVGVSIEL